MEKVLGIATEIIVLILIIALSPILFPVLIWFSRRAEEYVK